MSEEQDFAESAETEATEVEQETASAEPTDDELMAMLADTDAPASFDAESEDEQPEDESGDDAIDDSEVADDEVEDEQDDADEPRVLTIDDVAAEFADILVDTGDGKHKIDAILTRHRDVQIAKQKAAESRKEAEGYKQDAEAAQAIKLRLQNDSAGLALDALRVEYGEALPEVLRVLERHGYTSDKGRAAMAEAKLQQKDAKQGRPESEVINLRNELEINVGNTFTDAQWDAIYSRAESLESDGADVVEAIVKSVGDLYPDVLERFQSSQQQPVPAPEKKPRKSVRPTARRSARQGLDGASDKELMAEWARRVGD